jgi:Protein of unknown function (DUF3168)
MSAIEPQIYALLQGLAAGRMYPDVAPEGTLRPYITYQGAGGRAINFLKQAPPGLSNARVQINVWADTRGAASALARLIEDTLRTAPGLQVTVEGAPVSIYETDTKLRGSMQDFSFWSTG